MAEYTVAKRGRPAKVVEAIEPAATELPSTPVPHNSVNLDQLATDTTLFNKKSPANVKGKLTNELSRREEIEAAIVKERGRYIESTDNAKPGVPFSSRGGNEGASHPYEFAKPLEIAFRAEGVTLGGDILDTGEGAQDAPVEDRSDPNNPRSPSYMTCKNGNCQYRMGCLRYRMNNQRTNAAIRFPDECRLEGFYQSIDETNFTGYSPVESIELTRQPKF
jgi:hypothetical protein